MRLQMRPGGIAACVLMFLCLLAVVWVPAKAKPVAPTMVSNLTGSTEISPSRWWYALQAPYPQLPAREASLSESLNFKDTAWRLSVDWVARVWVANQDDSLSLCSGVLLRPDWVLTTRHCLANHLRKIRVWINSASASPLVIDHFRTFREGDAVLLHLQQPVARVLPAVLSAAPVRVGKPATMLGWGANGQRVQSLPQRIKATCYTVLSADGAAFESDCSGMTAEGSFGYKASWPGIRTEAGDSGGPLVIDGKVVAILIGGNSRASYYFSVIPLVDWIQDVAGARVQ